MAEWSLERRGWKITGRQVPAAGGHKCDFTAVNLETGEEWLVEVKVWGAAPSGKDTVKKAIADAYDLVEAGETRPFMLVLSHALGGLLGDMITRARRAGAINDVQFIGLYPSDTEALVIDGEDAGQEQGGQRPLGGDG